MIKGPNETVAYGRSWREIVEETGVSKGTAAVFHRAGFRDSLRRLAPQGIAEDGYLLDSGSHYGLRSGLVVTLSRCPSA